MRRQRGAAHSAAAGFTLAEVMVSAAGSILVIAALIVGTLQLQRSMRASETYASSHADQRRLLDYLARDLRRAITIERSEDGTSRHAAGETLDLNDGVELVLTLPGYYRSDSPTSADFDQTLPVVPSSTGVDYGTSAGPAPAVTVTFRKLFLAAEGCVCVVREEGGASEVIVRQAQDLNIQIAVSGDAKTCNLQATFQSRYSRARALVTSRDSIMLRNPESGLL